MSNNNNDNIIWNIIDKYFQDNPNILVRHHLDSYNDFFNNKIYNIFREKNPIKIFKEQDETSKNFKFKADIYIGGKEGNKLYFGKPVIFDETHEHYMFPNEARLRNMSYGTTLHVDVEVVYNILDEENNYVTSESLFEKIYLGKFPIMLNSDLCILNSLTSKAKFNMGECKNDRGGYFIIDGKEKVLVSQEKFADNMLYVRGDYNDIYSHSAEIRSVSEDSSKPVRTLSIRIMRPSIKYTNNQILVNIPNVRKPVPLFILMRALGILSDKEIISYCLLDLDINAHLIDYFRPSIHDAGNIYNQEVAIKYIATLTKGKTVSHTMEILIDYLLPHIGETNFQSKAYYIGYMVNKLLKVFVNEEKPTDRDSFKFKRVELAGSLIYDLFKEYYSLQQKHIFQKMDKEYYYKQGIYQENFISLIDDNINEYFREKILETGFKKAFKGSWGAEEHTHRPEVIQDLNRLSYNSFMSHLRKLNLPLDSSAKVVGPRLLHSSQWGIIDPVDTPDGGNVGLHKHMSLGAHITSGYSSKPIIEFLRKVIFMELLEECTTKYISKSVKVFVNGAWVGIVTDPTNVIIMLKKYRRLGLLPIYTSITWSIKDNIIYIYSDSGRLSRPIFYVENTNISYNKEKIYKKLLENEFTFNELLLGFNKFKDTENFKNNLNSFIKSNKVFFNIQDLYSTSGSKIEEILKKLDDESGIIDYIDTSEAENSLIANYEEDITKYTSHLEIHPSLLLGIMGNQIVFPENNQLPRDLFSCGQSKQGVSLYNSNFQNRIDKMGVILNNGQIPLVKSRYLKYIYNEEHPYGINAIVAIGCYGSYNVEDSILFNEGSIKRGMFNTTYFNMYEAREETSKIGGSNIDSKFAKIENENVVGKKPGYDYSLLDENGLIKENSQLDDKKVIIGKITTNINNQNNFLDASITPKKGQLGFVDKSFITEGEEGYRLAKVRIREERIPAMGDKFCSRCGQKGTVGLIIPEENMPFTDEGLRPDLIINPHALPSRMTIGQLVETLMGKACAVYGGYGDCTAFVNKGPKYETFGRMLKEVGYNSTGNELLYSGETGEQLQMELFMGPCYYMRLKHMVKDKINYRAQGPRTVLTRQTVQGRANDGGLRIGEMERDCVIAHGATKFLQESMLKRGDEYQVAICNNSGAIAIYNKEKNIFISPFADGPLKFNTSIEGNQNIEVVSKYGRSFSIVKIPYALKLLIQELQVMNIQMRIITEDNVEQLTSMNFSKTIDLIKKNNLTKQQKRELFDEKYVEAQEIKTLDETKLLKKEAEKDLDEESDKESVESTYSETDDSLKARLNRVRQESLNKAQESYEQSKDLENSDSDSDEESKPPISIDDKPLTEKLSNAFNSFVETLSGKPEENKKSEENEKPENALPKPEVLPKPQDDLTKPKSILQVDTEPLDEKSNDDEKNLDNTISKGGSNLKNISFDLI